MHRDFHYVEASKIIGNASRTIEKLVGRKQAAVLLAERLWMALNLDSIRSSRNGEIPYSTGLEYLMRGIKALIENGDPTDNYTQEHFKRGLEVIQAEHRHESGVNPFTFLRLDTR